MAYRRPFLIGYYHHGIYIGDDEIIHYTDIGVERVSFADFKNGCKVFVVRYNPGECYNDREVVKRAHEYHARDSFGKYQVVNNNCQHFATEVKTGKAWSDQAIRARFLSLGSLGMGW